MFAARDPGLINLFELGNFKIRSYGKDRYGSRIDGTNHERIHDLLTWVLLTAQADQHSGTSIQVLNKWLSEWISNELLITMSFKTIEVDKNHLTDEITLHFTYVLTDDNNMKKESDQIFQDVYKL